MNVGWPKCLVMIFRGKYKGYSLSLCRPCLLRNKFDHVLSAVFRGPDHYEAGNSPKRTTDGVRYRERGETEVTRRANSDSSGLCSSIFFEQILPDSVRKLELINSTLLQNTSSSIRNDCCKGLYR